MLYLIQISSEPPGPQGVNLIGPFESHAEANGVMQRYYDDACNESEIVESDDSDANHFYALSDDDIQLDWFIVEMQRL